MAEVLFAVKPFMRSASCIVVSIMKSNARSFWASGVFCGDPTRGLFEFDGTVAFGRCC